MAKGVLVPLNLNFNELQNVKLQALDQHPTDVDPEAVLYYNDTTHKIVFHNGTDWVSLEDSGSVSGIATLGVTSPITNTGSTNDPVIGINPAGTSTAGSMSAAHYTLLSAATENNQSSTLVLRDANGNFSAGTITANLTGSASLFGGSGPAHYLNRENHTGTQLADTISNLATTVQAYRLDQFANPTSNINLNNNRIVGMADPVADTDAANKRYVDSLSAGLDYKESVRVATTTNISLSGTQTIDGVAVTAGNRVLVVAQTNPAQNGIYTVASGSWTRSPDAVDGNLTSGAWVYVEDGTANGGKKYVLATKGNIVVGTTPQEWVVYGAGEILTAGDGLSKDGSEFSAVGTANRITVGAGGIDIASNYAGQSSISTLGTVTTGTWQGTAVGVAYGGTGRTTFTAGDFLVGNGSNGINTRTGAQVLSDIGAAAATHKHDAADVESGRFILARMPTSATANRVLKVGTANSSPVYGQVDYSELTGVPSTFTPSSHSHNADDINSGTLDIARIPTGTSAGTVATGNHNHSLDSLSNVTISSNTNGEILRWNGSAWVNNTLAEAGIAAASHVHDIGEVSGLQAALEGKSDTGHVHGTGDITSGTFSVARGGTGRSSLTSGHFLRGNGTGQVTLSSPDDVRSAIGAIRKFVGTISGSNRTITHNLGTKDVTVSVYEGDDEVIVDAQTTTVNTVTIGLAANPVVDLRVVITG